MTRRMKRSPIFSRTPPSPRGFCQQKHFVFQSDCVELSLSKKEPHNDFPLFPRFRRECTFSLLISKVSRRVSTLHHYFFFFLHSSAPMQLHFPKQDLCWRTALSVFFCQGPSLLIIHCLTLSDPAVVTGFTTRSLVVLKGEVSQDEQVTDR